jgi:hypothetical protein
MLITVAVVISMAEVRDTDKIVAYNFTQLH